MENQIILLTFLPLKALLWKSILPFPEEKKGLILASTLLLDRKRPVKAKNMGTTEPNDILKATALLYLEEALLKEEYELCQELIGKAEAFGAHASEIDALIGASIKKKMSAPRAAQPRRFA